MSRMFMLASVAAWSFLCPAAAAEIKPRLPDTAFSGKLMPDIIGLSVQDDAVKAGAVLEAYLKEFPGAKPQAEQRKFGNDTTYVPSMTFSAAATPKRGAESISIFLTAPSSGNTAYYITRDLEFARDAQPAQGDMIQRVVAKYGEPTAIGDGHLYYFYKSGKIVSVKQKYSPDAAIAALNAPLNPKVAVTLSDASGRGSCVAILKHVQASTDKSLPKLINDAKVANCDGLLDVTLSSGSATDRVSKATFTLIDFKRIVSALKIDTEAMAADRTQPQKSSSGAPRL